MEKIGEGLEVECFLIDGIVEKYFKTNPQKKIILNKDSIEKMKSIKTERILLPTSEITDQKNNLIGYKMKYIKNLGSDSFFTLEKESLRKETELIRKDIENLSDKKVVIEDLLDENTSYHNGLYIIDPGAFRFDDSIDINQAYGINIDLINNYLIFEVIRNYHLNRYNKNFNFASSYSFSRMINKEYNRSGSNDVLEYLSNIEENSLDEFVEKRISK